MEDQTGYAQFSRGAYVAHEDTAAQWPTVLYNLREPLDTLSLVCKLTKDSKGLARGGMANEVELSKGVGEPLGMEVDDSNVAVAFVPGGVAKKFKLHVFEGWAVSHVNGEAVKSPEQFKTTTDELDELRIRFARTQTVDADVWSTQLTVSWQKKYPHPRELIAIWERDPADPERQSLVQFLQTEYVLPDDAELAVGEEPPPAVEAAPFSEATMGLIFRRAQAAPNAPTVALGAVLSILELPEFHANHPAYTSLCEYLHAHADTYLNLAELQHLLGSVQIPQDPALHAKFMHLLGRTVICTFTAHEPHEMDNVLLESVTTASAEDRTLLSLRYMKGHMDPPLEGQSFDPVVEFNANPPVVDQPPGAAAGGVGVGDTDIRGAVKQPGGGMSFAGDSRAGGSATGGALGVVPDKPKRGQVMWVVAAFGHVVRRRGRLAWISHKDVVLAHLEAQGKSSFNMWPPFNHLGAVVSQRRREDDRHDSAPAVTPYKLMVPVYREPDDARAQINIDTTAYNYTLELGEEAAPPAGDDGADIGGESGVSDEISNHSEPGRVKDDAEKRLDMLNRVVHATRRQMQAARSEGDEEGKRRVYSGPLATVPHESRVHFFGDIISARDFSCTNLFIRFELVLPPWGWQVETTGTHAPSPLFRQAGERYVLFTQTSSMVRRTLPDGCHTSFFAFAMPFELHCIAKLGQSYPRMLMEVYSERASEMHQLEGYGHIDLATSLGGHRSVVRCWKPVPTVREHLRDFFLGCTTNHLRDPSFIAVPDGFRGRFLNKFGFHCTTTGQVEVRWNCMIQSSDPWATEMSRSEPPPERHGAERTVS